MRPRLLLLALAVLPLAFAPAPFPRSGRARPLGDLERLQGVWEIVESRYEGAESEMNKGARIEVRGGRWSFSFPREREASLHWDFSLDPASMRSEFKNLDGSRASLGVYRFEGDSFVLCYSTREGVQPTSVERDTHTFLQMRRTGR